jgi:hypothetical protein
VQRQHLPYVYSRAFLINLADCLKPIENFKVSVPLNRNTILHIPKILRRIRSDGMIHRNPIPFVSVDPRSVRIWVREPASGAIVQALDYYVLSCIVALRDSVSTAYFGKRGQLDIPICELPRRIRPLNLHRLPVCEREEDRAEMVVSVSGVASSAYVMAAYLVPELPC